MNNQDLQQAESISMIRIMNIVKNLVDSLPSHSYDQIRRTWHKIESIQIVESWLTESGLSDSSALSLCLNIVAAYSTMQLMEKLGPTFPIDLLYITQGKLVLPGLYSIIVRHSED